MVGRNHAAENQASCRVPVIAASLVMLVVSLSCQCHVGEHDDLQRSHHSHGVAHGSNCAALLASVCVCVPARIVRQQQHSIWYLRHS